MVKVYSLSTCPWCKKMKRFLDEEGIDFESVDVDLAGEDEKNQAFSEMNELGVSPAFPITVVEDEVVQGYDPDKVRKLVEESNG